MRFCRVLITVIFGSLFVAHAEVRLPHALSDHAVLQRDQPIHVWGWGDPGETVTVTFRAQKVMSAAGETGLWDAWLKPEAAGGPYNMTVQGDRSSKRIDIVDILIGDVWIASGQSNMEFPLSGFPNAPLKNGENEIAAATNTNIRMLVQRHSTSTYERSEQEDSWSECNPNTAKRFSAVAYFFARELVEREKIPVGIIDATWGGTPAHSWISPQGLAEANLTSVFVDAGRIARDQGHAEDLKDEWARQDMSLRSAGKSVTPRRVPGDHGESWTPGALFNAMIAPDTKYTIKGVIWYQGEQDTAPERAPHYAAVFKALIEDWRRRWAQGDFPFLFVQISSYSSGDQWGVVRDAQRRALELVNTGMVVTLDVGNPKNVHPSDKQTVGIRLAGLAIAQQTHDSKETSSPMLDQTSQEGSSIRIWLSHAAGLTAYGKPIGGFEVAGEDHHFYSAEAKIELIGGSETVLLSNQQVKQPRYARYGWSSVVTDYLYNAEGLPLGTFSSEP